eukprot:65470-Alexandrium_andersonii.AAC.1
MALNVPRRAVEDSVSAILSGLARGTSVDVIQSPRWLWLHAFKKAQGSCRRQRQRNPQGIGVHDISGCQSESLLTLVGAASRSTPSERHPRRCLWQHACGKAPQSCRGQRPRIPKRMALPFCLTHIGVG